MILLNQITSAVLQLLFFQVFHLCGISLHRKGSRAFLSGWELVQQLPRL